MYNPKLYLLSSLYIYLYMRLIECHLVASMCQGKGMDWTAKHLGKQNLNNDQSVKSESFEKFWVVRYLLQYIYHKQTIWMN